MSTKILKMYRNNNFQIKNSSRTVPFIFFLQKGSIKFKKSLRLYVS